MLSRLIVTLTFCLLSFSPLSFAKETDARAFVKKVLNKYNQTSGVQADITKKVWIDLLEEDKTSDGELSFAKGLMRIELKGNESTVITMTSDTLWVETAGVSADAKPQVAQIVSKDMAKMSRAPLALMFSRSKSIDQFNVKGDEVVDGVRKLTLVPKDLSKWKDLQKLYLEVEPKELVIKTAQYEDENQNRTTFSFRDTKFDQKFKKSLFKYSPPKGADVTVYR